MANQGTVGNQSAGGLGRNTDTNLRLDSSAALVTVNGHGRYQEMVLKGNTYLAANQAATAITALATAVTGFCLTNPVASGRNLVLIDCCVAFATAPAGAATCGYAYNASATAVTHTTPLTVRNALLPGNGSQTASNPTGVGLVDGSATTPTAGVAVRALGGGPVGAVTLNTAFVMDAIDGKLILSPGSYLHLFYETTAISVIASMCWEEIGLVGGYNS